ncbi:hypothetical protein MLD38_007204 [Melastoma candidum]|uniref:Uncharacterized protein n=1 Tax=Melastoma candidum TaxID=119954 RepID=A0ACB9RQX2_9MYRT|nr:hypothetical protein MLD38_007204 [Melastoma candidum]
MADSSFKSTAPSHAHPETMDFLSRAWCNFAIQAFQPDREPEWHERSALVLLDPPVEKFEKDATAASPFLKMEKSLKMDDSDYKPLPSWKANDVKSWIWMQQAMHPELNYSSCFRKRWAPWDVFHFSLTSIKKWLKEMKQRRKEEGRLQRAEAHAALSVAGLAAALAAIAAENSKSANSSDAARETAVASAAAIVASQCAQVAEALGAKKEQLSSAITSAMISTSAADILTLTATATTSLRGAATLKARRGCRNATNNEDTVLPIEHHKESDCNFENRRSILVQGTKLNVEMAEGRYKTRFVSIILTNESKVIIKITKLSLLKSSMQSTVLDMHAELYEDSEEEDAAATCYLLVLSTAAGTIKLDFSDDYKRYKTWSATLSELLMLSRTYGKYELDVYKRF